MMKKILILLAGQSGAYETTPFVRLKMAVTTTTSADTGLATRSSGTLTVVDGAYYGFYSYEEKESKPGDILVALYTRTWDQLPSYKIKVVNETNGNELVLNHEGTNVPQTHCDPEHSLLFGIEDGQEFILAVYARKQ